MSREIITIDNARSKARAVPHLKAKPLKTALFIVSRQYRATKEAKNVENSYEKLDYPDI